MLEDATLVFQNINVIILLIIIFLPGYIALFTTFHSKKKPKNYPQWNEIKLFDKIIWCILISMFLMFFWIAFLYLIFGIKEIGTNIAISGAILVSLVVILYNWSNHLMPKMKKKFYKEWPFFRQLNWIYNKIYAKRKSVSNPKIKIEFFGKKYYPFYIIMDVLLKMIIILIAINALCYAYIAIWLLSIMSVASSEAVQILASVLNKIITGVN